MTSLKPALQDLRRDLDDLGVRWALIGGLAVSARSEPRTTWDIDVTVSVASDREAESLVRDLRVRGYRIREEGLIEQEATGRLATVRCESPVRAGGFNVVVDLMFASSGIEPEIVEAAEVLEVVGGAFLPVARTGHLIALKILADRPQDRVDLGHLLSVADTRDVEMAADAARLITARGAHRGRDLLAALRSATT